MLCLGSDLKGFNIDWYMDIEQLHGSLNDLAWVVRSDFMFLWPNEQIL